MSEATIYLIKALGDVLTLAILFGFLFRLFKVDYFNPIVQGIIKITDVPTGIIRTAIKPIFGIDIASLFSAIIIQSFCLYLIVISGALNANFFNLLEWSFFSVFLLIIKILFYSMFAGIILSWISPSSSHPAVRIIFQLSEPLFQPFRKLIPPMGGIDFSPILAFIALNFLETIFRNFAIQVGVPYGVLMGF
tara:strand:- start:11474 stop:12049 length:576 start_codon:yes stop_codon:yes gene_type:complete